MIENVLNAFQISPGKDMSSALVYLPGNQQRAHWMRLDAARVLKRCFYCERALLLAEAGWLPLLPMLEAKTELPRFIWQSALTAGALRERVFELRYPSRLLDVDDDAPLIALWAQLQAAPSAAAFLNALTHSLLPALRDAYAAYLATSDSLADGPTHRFLQLALAEKEQQIATMQGWASAAPSDDAATDERWLAALRERLARLGGVSIALELPTVEPLDALPGAHPYTLPSVPARDERFLRCRFYWPDIVDASFPYGEGIRLQLRSAISHLNEVWAVETAGVILHAFADELPWEWVLDAARWCYDEARHCRMGYERLLAWGYRPAELPLGDYIYASAAGQDLIYRLGMLFFFETKNIRHKPSRAKLFADYGDAVSRHDMEYDWADETIHAGYGKHWLSELLARRGQPREAYEAVRERCGALVAAYVATATDHERQAIRQIAEALIAKAESRS
jgi:uncharacterized ferritin-like protein (DUF455 family)